jgi:hypothetical protein
MNLFPNDTNTNTNTWSESNNSVLTLETYTKAAEIITQHIELDTLININDYDMADKLTFLIGNRNKSPEIMNIYKKLICSFEQFDLMYANKFIDLKQFILERIIMTDEKNTLIMDNDGNYMLVVMPMLERTHRRGIYTSIENEELYTLMLSIKNSMKNIRHYENRFSRQINMNITDYDNKSTHSVLM